MIFYLEKDAGTDCSCYSIWQTLNLKEKHQVLIQVRDSSSEAACDSVTLWFLSTLGMTSLPDWYYFNLDDKNEKAFKFKYNHVHGSRTDI